MNVPPLLVLITKYIVFIFIEESKGSNPIQDPPEHVSRFGNNVMWVLPEKLDSCYHRSITDLAVLVVACS
jgi:hypothetical protein